ncbi:MAG: nucleotidyltransferase domain-containing protein [Bacteroidales bacterium]|nr:nucleotidyltransferase domain-containing protein [Bacteroidales bacterium]
MDKNEAVKIAKRYIDSISDRFQVERAILFGSFAKGTNHPDSDIDIAIVFKTVDDIIDLQIELMQLRSDDDLLIEPHPFKVSDFYISNPLVAEIEKNGIEIQFRAA